MAFELKVDSKSLSDLSKGLGSVMLNLGHASASAINTTVDSTTKRSKITITTQINLTPPYVDKKFSVTKATDDNPTATITARDGPTVLTRFNAKQVITPATRAKGDRSRAIPPGYKSGGVSVNVKTGGARGVIEHGFLMKLRAGAVSGGNGFGVFTRTGPGKNDYRQRYGPSVDQAFKVVLREIAPSVGQELEANAVKELDKTIEKVFAK